ncbi:MAG: hypothetical protein DLM68_03945 [Hyphomicrobiales bacterium]|nr:MAG: hypothetical protein DLM68_03945 [Hyphomicrobiales bacterium]
MIGETTLRQLQYYGTASGQLKLLPSPEYYDTSLSSKHRQKGELPNLRLLGSKELGGAPAGDGMAWPL